MFISSNHNFATSFRMKAFNQLDPKQSTAFAGERFQLSLFAWPEFYSIYKRLPYH